MIVYLFGQLCAGKEGKAYILIRSTRLGFLPSRPPRCCKYFLQVLQAEDQKSQIIAETTQSASPWCFAQER